MDQQDIHHPKTEATPAPSRAALRAQEAAKRMAAFQRKTLLSLCAFALCIAAGVGYFLYGPMVTEVSANNLKYLSNIELTNRQNPLQDYFKREYQTLDRLAQNPDIINSLSPDSADQPDKIANTPEARAELARVLVRAIPNALSLRIFPLGSAALDRDAKYPLRYAELDLIHRAEAGADFRPEVISIDNHWLINWVRPIKSIDGAQVLGSFLLVMDATPLISTLTDANKNLGEYHLYQLFNGSPIQSITKVGNGSAGATVQANIAGSSLLVKFTPSKEMIYLAEESPSLWIAVIAAISAALLVLAWIASKVILRAELRKQNLAAPSLGELVNITKSTPLGEDAVSNPMFQKQDILDITMIDEDQDILGIGSATGKQAKTGRKAALSEEDVPREIFRSYDIRGLVGDQLNPELAMKIGQAIGSEALDQGETSILVARDGRTHSASLTAALIKGILQTGCHVINIGVVPTPLLYFATFQVADTNAGVMVTASHNPKEYNGFKVVINNNALSDDGILELRNRILAQRLHQGAGSETTREIIPHYIDRIFSDVALAGNVSLVIDAGNAVPGIVAPQLFEELGCDVTPLFCELDGNFPNHNPDPTEVKNLQALIAKVQEVNADMGVAFDGDGDRLVVVTPKGDIIWPDRMLMLFARDILARHPGADVLFDVKCSRQLNQVISSYGGRPIMWKTGHSPMKAKMVETGALIGGEYSGHIFIKDRWYGFDDGLYAMARLLEIITLRDQSIDDIFASFPPMLNTPELKIAVAEQDKFAIIEKLAAQGDFQNGSITDIDGLRVDYPKGWGLVRASNTSPALTLRFEAENTETLAKIQHLFKRELQKIDSNLTFTF